MRVRLKFNSSLPIRLEYALTRHGFSYWARKKGEFVVYERDLIPQTIDRSDLSEDVVAELARKVNRIAGSFENPDAHKEQIKVRCTNLARTMLPKQRQWVLDWIKRVIDEDDGDSGQPYGDDYTPWAPDLKEQEAQLNLGQGFC